MSESKRKFEAEAIGADWVEIDLEKEQQRGAGKRSKKVKIAWKAPCNVETIYRIMAVIQAL